MIKNLLRYKKSFSFQIILWGWSAISSDAFAVSRSTPGAGMSSAYSGSSSGLQSSDGSASSESRPVQIGDYVELSPSVRNEMYGTIDYPNAELKDIVKAISQLAQKNFILDRKIENRRVTIISPQAVTKQEAYNAFLSALYINDLTLISVGKFLQIIDAKTAIQNNTRVYVGDYAPESEEIVTLLYPLRNLNAEDVQRYLVDLVPRNGRITAYPNTNTLVMTGTGINLRRVISILKSIDIPGHQDQLENIPILHASAKGIADLIDQILDAQAGGGNRARAGRARNEPQKTRGGGIISKIVPDERTNSLVVLANGRGIEELKMLISKLDSPNASGSGNIHIYYCKNAKAEEISETINSLINKDRKPSSNAGTNPLPLPSTQSGGRTRNSDGISLEGNMKVTADKSTNSLVIVGSSSDYTSLKNILDRLDIPRKQVYIEATIMEIASRDDKILRVGVNVGANGMPRVGGFIPTGLNITDYVTSPVGLSGVVAGIGAGAKYPHDFYNPLTKKMETRTISSVIGLINAIQTSGQGQILHQPQIMTSDNQPGEITIREKVPVPESSQESGSGSTTIQTVKFNKEEINVTLKVTPQVGENNDLVKMQVEQSIDDFTLSKLPKASDNGQVDVTQRKANTVVSVRDGDTVVIGGLQKVAYSDSRDKVPLLGDLPVIGWLFKGSKSEQTRSNLVIFLTPKIINEYRDIIKLTGEKLATRERFGAKLSDPEDKLIKEVRDLQEKNKRDATKAPPRSWSFKPNEEDASLKSNESAWVNGLQPERENKNDTVAPQVIEGAPSSNTNELPANLEAPPAPVPEKLGG